MIEDLYFLDDGKVKISAATVGISKKRWEYIHESEDDGINHIKKMKSQRFDHLPIVSKNGNINEFYKTKAPDNFEHIEKHTISFEDIIPLNTNIETIIDKFHKEKRTFYFLSFNDDVSGLITIGNLNCKQVQIYIFSLICELEKELALFVNYHLSHEEILDWLNEKAIAFEQANMKDKCKTNKYQSIINQYEELVESGLENYLTEHFFLVDLFNIILKKKLFKNLSYSGNNWEDLNSINNIRNKIAHPTRSLLDKNNTIDKLWERLLKIKKLLFKLNSYKKNQGY
ncbi:hypothetical protein [Mangrovimonas cancribranchiae]|uniref:RiboL-PSP-HEPN domain-containing protein n=1 Tax=Mangrovimonas cancribranchiae TaxID=3080055 RepID=A0AAU6NZP5_9FLAO